jgi:hypothetical protein
VTSALMSMRVPLRRRESAIGCSFNADGPAEFQRRNLFFFRKDQ